ncbi:hypothetical protein HUN01_34245 [Nostoc edaphicum CCNP1411]|uniref:Uncharacterized protein n=1 Tax=Nostoc edaphicum CCNP1411 TaxID=1472755 RepID=A0A7D7RA98_9NOSO|nr:hypothetical protein [Nostoc edaphicum]QMS92406.1 hypothetical protein HUN01_34245 [Nostoc edaphicum CCNP1411]
MNPAQLKKTTAKASRVTKKLRRRFDFTQSAMPGLGAQYALTWFEVIGYTVLLEPDITLGKHQIGRSSYSDVVLYYPLLIDGMFPINQGG